MNENMEEKGEEKEARPNTSIRLPAEIAERCEREAKELGHPHTRSSRILYYIKRGMEAVDEE